MKIQEQDLYHGAALTQVVESADFTALNRDPEKYGMYLLNHDRRLLIKHSSKARTDGRFQFTFAPNDLTELTQRDADYPGKVFVALVSGTEVICALSMDDVAKLVDFATAASQWVTVEAPPNKQLRTRGSRGDGPLVPQNAFPAKVLT